MGDLPGDKLSQSGVQSDAPVAVDGDGEGRRDASGTSGEQPAPGESNSARTLEVTKFASLRGLFVYFCRDEECYRYTILTILHYTKLPNGVNTPPRSSRA